MRHTDEELLKLVGEERKRSIGFGEAESGELIEARERALRFYRGDVSKDIPVMANRSAAVSTDVAEAIETALPDLVEIFIGGDDVATFQARSAQDEPQAQVESDYVKHVIFAENDGFTTFNTAFKDALLIKTGLFHWWWEEEEDEETSPPFPAEAAPVLLSQTPPEEQAGVEMSEPDEQGQMTATRKVMRSKVCVKAVPPEDFTVARDTVMLRDTTYCAMRDRPRVQDLIARGVDEETARGLKSYTQPNQAISDARDEAGEQSLTRDDGSGDLRQVEVRSHFIRLLDDDGGLSVWRIDTDSEETVLISKEEVPSIPFGAITPYMNAHRFYGESVADKLVEIQKIKTTLLRMFLDSGYFALNQRMTVNMNLANEFTISDLLNNVPNMPIRTNGDAAVLPVSAGALQFDALAALEHVSVMGEQRTGIVRNAQGLNPDTLHDTAKGAIALITAAQKRLRYIARVFAETGVRDLFLGVHELLRQGYGQEAGEGVYRSRPHVKIGQEWKDVDPAQWPERKGVDVQVGVGSAGREHDLMVATQLLQVQEAMLVNGLGGRVVSEANIYAAAKRYLQAANWKTPEVYFTDPAQQPPPQPKPDPEMAKVQSQAQLEQAKAQGQMQLSQAQAQAQLQLEHAKTQAKSQADTIAAQNDMQLSMAKMQGEMELKRYQIDQELQLKREQLAAELQLKRELGFAQASVTHEVGMAKVNASTSQVEPGGEPG